MLRGMTVVIALCCSSLLAQQALSYIQLRDMLKSSVEQRIPDKEIANYLKSEKLGFALTDALIEDFQGLGVGFKTLAALRKLQPSTNGLRAAQTDSGATSKRRQPPPPPEEEQRRIIAETRRAALEYTRDLPDFICVQLTRRYFDPSGLEMDWLKHDEVKTRVSYFEGHENYEVISVNNRLTNRTVEELGGATSTGEFGSMLAELFSPKTDTQFRWARHSLLRGHGVYVFHYQVPRRRSRWRLKVEGVGEIITAYRGLIYVDKQTERVLRLVMTAEDIPVDFPMQEARTTLDYAFTEIGGAEYLFAQ